MSIIKKFFSKSYKQTRKMSIKLTYMDVEGRAEPTRIALHAAGVEFVDERLGFGEMFARKDEFPKLPIHMQLPLLAIDGKVLSQSMSVFRYVGQKYGMVPTDLDKNFKVNEMLELALDIWTSGLRGELLMMSPQSYGHGDLSKEERKAVSMQVTDKAVETTMPLIMTTANKEWVEQGILSGDHISIADVWMFHVLRSMKTGKSQSVPTDFFDKHENMVALYEKMNANPGIAAYYKL